VSTPRVISLFTGAGGIDYGLEAAGYETAVAVEIDPDCCATLRQNRSWQVIERDIFDVSSDEILAAGSLKRGHAALLVGGPPCQPFSKAGLWANGQTARLGDARASTLHAYIRVLEDTLPQAFLLENVDGFSYRGKDEGLRLVLDSIDRINERTGAKYTPTVHLVNAADVGVPQARRRLLIAGARDGATFTFPGATHAAPGQDSDLPSHRTAWDALGDLNEPDSTTNEEDLAVRGRWADLLPSIPEGHNYLWFTSEMGHTPLFGWRTRYWSFLLKLAKNRPSWTIAAQPGPGTGPFHWKNRRLSMRELCRLQTFPDDVVITGSRGAIQRQIGNAVPSLLAEVIGREIGAQILGRKRRKLKLLPPDRSPAPPAEKTRRKPEKYKTGKHAPHPGTGLGPGARSRPVPAR